ncbi:MAG: hypothetical protein JWQ61_204 [Collimonas fungivorans]|uniref:ABC transporter permease n=1 Tax=Collimonas fungivorans TaxID=158899 RepID=UPI0026F34A96|nr:ABC transporter permease [Collimonas fungivorans]MDB5765390.1 hypothetical protein [Collimonas fungivorans]
MNNRRLSAAQAFTNSALRECEHLRRDRWDLALATLIPILILVMFGWFFSDGVPRKLPIVVVDQDRSTLSRELVRMLDENAGLYIASQPTSVDAAWPSLRNGTAYALILIGPNTSRDVLRGGSATLVAWYNASYRTAGQAASGEISKTVQAFGARVAFDATAAIRGPRSLRAAPIAIQTSVLGNPARSYEHFLLGLIFPAVLHLVACLLMVSAIGRELRNRSAGEWLAVCDGRILPAVTGKLFPYVLLFLLYGAFSLAWIAGIRGAGVTGSVLILLLGYLLMLAAYAGVALLFVGATRNMGTALSLTGIYAGTSLAFSGGSFPVLEAPVFVRVWNAILPYTHYVQLQAQQLDFATPWTDSLPQLLILLLFIAVAGGLGLLLYGRAARNPAAWGLR